MKKSEIINDEYVNFWGESGKEFISEKLPSLVKI